MFSALQVLKPRVGKIEIPPLLNILPESFLFYLQFYEQSYDDYPFQLIKIMNPKNQQLYNIGYKPIKRDLTLTIEGDKIIGMENIQDLVNNLGLKTYWIKEGYLFIGSTHANHILLNFKKGEGYGSIYFQLKGEKSYNCVANNIFDFFYKIKLTYNTEFFEKFQLNINEIYKNWNEDFWRIKE